MAVRAVQRMATHSVEEGACVRCNSPTIEYSSGSVVDHKFIFDAVFDANCSQVEFKCVA